MARTSQPVPLLFLEPVGSRGGAEVVMLDLVRGLDRTRFSPHAALLAPGPLAAQLEELDVPVATFPAHRTRNVVATVRAVAGLAWLVRRWCIRLVHTQGTKTHVYGGPLRWLTGVREVWHVYDEPPDPPTAIDRVATAIPTDRLLFISPAPRRGFARLVDVSGAAVVHPGVPEPRPLRPELAARVLERLSIRVDAPFVLQIGRMQAFKGQAHLVRAMAALSERFPDLCAVLVGTTSFGLEPGYPGELASLVRELGVGDRVALAGPLTDDEVAALMDRCACLCYAEVRGPYSLVILEAMARARPVVASRTDGSELIVGDGVTGLLVPPADPAALARALSRVVADDRFARTLGEAGRARQRARFTIEAMVRETQDVWEEALRSGRPL